MNHNADVYLCFPSSKFAEMTSKGYSLIVKSADGSWGFSRNGSGIVPVGFDMSFEIPSYLEGLGIVGWPAPDQESMLKVVAVVASTDTGSDGFTPLNGLGR